ncbi:hypothetical protein P5V15_007088 [Pogonomyrmex californicus]
MIVPTFADLQGFVVGRRFVVKEVTVLRKGTILSHYIFASPIPWHLLTKSDKSCASWLIANHHGLRWEDEMIPYSMAERLITTGVIDIEDKALIYVKGCQKKEWLTNMLDSDARDDVIIETLDIDYKESLNNLDVNNTF